MHISLQTLTNPFVIGTQGLLTVNDIKPDEFSQAMHDRFLRLLCWTTLDHLKIR